jgi:hypothetical protein
LNHGLASAVAISKSLKHLPLQAWGYAKLTILATLLEGMAKL